MRSGRYHITAYFLDWLEDVYGPGTVVWINAQLRGRKYDPGMWELLSGGRDVDALWESYAEFYSIGGSKRRTKPSKPSKPVHEPAAAASAMTVPLVAVYHAAPPPDRATFTVTQETEVVAQGPDSVESLPDTMEPYDPFAFGGETALVEIFRQRLAELRFDGTKDGKRFVKEFEGLVQRVVPGISEEDRRLLLVGVFRPVVDEDFFPAIVGC